MLRRAFGVKYHQGFIFVNDFRGGLTLNRSATQQTSLPLLTAWCIKQYTSDIHLGWDDLASLTVRSNQAVRRPVRAHLCLSRCAICWERDVAISSVSFRQVVAWAKWDPSQYTSKRNQISGAFVVYALPWFTSLLKAFALFFSFTCRVVLGYS